MKTTDLLIKGILLKSEHAILMKTLFNANFEMLLWSIAFPGFGQILNGKILKGILFILLEFIVNTKSNLNTLIIASFYGDISTAIQAADYQWLMFYPCLYVFAIWDAYKDASEKASPPVFLPFVLAAYCGTIGVIFSPTFSIAGHTLGPVWNPILFMLLGGCTPYIYTWGVRKSFQCRRISKRF